MSIDEVVEDKEVELQLKVNEIMLTPNNPALPLLGFGYNRQNPRHVTSFSRPHISLLVDRGVRSDVMQVMVHCNPTHPSHHSNSQTLPTKELA